MANRPDKEIEEVYKSIEGKFRIQVFYTEEKYLCIIAINNRNCASLSANSTSVMGTLIGNKMYELKNDINRQKSNPKTRGKKPFNRRDSLSL